MDHPSEVELTSFAWGGTAVGVELAIHLDACEHCRAIVAKSRISTPVSEGELVGGKYRIERLLASGGIGAVVRALDIKLDRHVAIKFLLPNAAKDPKVRARFDLEARVAVKMQSEHVSRVLDVGDLPSGAQYIVLEYLRGEDLTVLLARDGRVAIEATCEYVLQACEAMAEAHSLGIVHRDLKPSNLFLTTRPDGSKCIKVIDFGIAKTINFRRESAPTIGLTHSDIIGTPGYMSPEQVTSSHNIDPRSDIWGLGVILYELMVGQAPFAAGSVEAVFAHILHEDPIPPSSLRPDVPKGLDQVIMRCLSRDPGRRFPNVADLARAIAPFAPPHARASADRALRVMERGSQNDLAATLPDANLSGSTAIDWVVRSMRGHRRWWIAALVFVALGVVAAGITFSLLRRSSPEVAIGTPCNGASCASGLQCVDGTCTKSCKAAADCPMPSKCTSDGTCSILVRAAFIYVGVPEDEGWTRTHDAGRKYAVAKLPFVETDYVINTFSPDDAGKAVDDFVVHGYRVIVATSFSLAATIAAKAKQYTDVRFLVVASHAPAPDVGAINARMYQAWYLAGYAAAQKSTTHRLGFLAALVTPELVRHINAFTRGAQLFDPNVVVEVRWLGFWFDAGKPDASGHYKEERLTAELLASGCDVIANHADNGRAVAAIEEAHTAATSIGNNSPDACDRGPTTCLGTAYWNWGPLYVDVLEALHRRQPEVHRWESIKANPEASIINFRLNPPVAGSKLALATAEVLADLTKHDRVFEGPFCSTGQRAACVREHESISDDELHTMCWFVAGVVEHTEAGDKPARVPPDCATNR